MISCLPTIPLCQNSYINTLQSLLSSKLTQNSMGQFFSTISQIITPPPRTGIQTIRRPRHSQEAQPLDKQIGLPQPTSFNQKRCLSSLVHTNSSNPRNLWKTVNNLLHRGNSNTLPDSIPHASIVDSFASFFTNKVSSLRLSLQTLLPTPIRNITHLTYIT